MTHKMITPAEVISLRSKIYNLIQEGSTYKYYSRIKK